MAISPRKKRKKERKKTTFTVHVTGCDLEKSIILEKKIKLQVTCAFRCTIAVEK